MKLDKLTGTDGFVVGIFEQTERKGSKRCAAVGEPTAVAFLIRSSHIQQWVRIDPSSPDDAPEKLAHLREIEACHSVAGDESYILKVRVGSPGELEALLQQIRAAANVSTRTSVVLSTPYEDRPPAL